MIAQALGPAVSFEVPYGRLAWALLLTLAAGLLLLFGLRRILGGGAARAGRVRLLRVLDALPIGPRRAIYVIEAAGRALVLAACGDRVSLLLELPALPEWAAKRAFTPTAPYEIAEPSSFFERVRDAAPQFEAFRPAPAPGAGDRS
jgi:flagellar biogenesis protein FliO